MPDPSEVLGVDPDADDETIESAYRRKVMQTHPDAGGNIEDFKRVKAAYERLVGGVSNNSGTVGRSQRGKVTVGIDCARCGSRVENESQGFYDRVRGDVFCHDCLIEVNCASCGRPTVVPEELRSEEVYCNDCCISTECEVCGEPLNLTPEEYDRVQGSPICVDCTENQDAGDGRGDPFTHCSLCDDPINRRMNATPGTKTGEYYCPGCVVDVECVRCGEELVITIEQYAEVEGNPVCMECDRSRGDNSAVSAITTWIMFLGVILAIFYVVFSRGFHIGLVSALESNKETIRIIVGPTSLFILYAIIKSVAESD